MVSELGREKIRVGDTVSQTTVLCPETKGALPRTRGPMYENEK